ncbi:putative receptor-like protein kinase At4g00960 isoform X1 [Chenopodium quinoa]|uniref:putative receptor-like protein kinase At4g00960 isoform X1 n=1 Tax=Chenopodium quinoa TaxID=63459 RepID=UPI000B78348B|nr:putative receptor-like protein kinase At4g00960 isoform X1 [Chenopodium quinoa]
MMRNWEIKDDATRNESIESCFEFSFSTIRASTNNFSSSNKLGQGGFGIVYKGRLPNGRLIAAKRLMRHSAHGEVEFKNEVKLVARLHHNNLLRLIGFCVQGNERILIYEFAPNGSLDFVLFDAMRREHLTWEIRYKIIQGIARGLLYLHEESQERIFHRDLKASNVLLDENMNPKISDFGTARLFLEDQTSASRIVGTYGYMAPEYAKYGKISVKVDVFSFGVLLLEIVSGRKNSTSHSPKQMEHLLSKSWKLWTSGKVLELIDPILLKTDSPVEEITRCIHIGLLCVQKNAACRPTMNLVILMLECCSQCLLPPSEPAYLIDFGDEEEPNVPVIGDHLYSPTALLSTSSNSTLSINQVSITDPYPEPR